MGDNDQVRVHVSVHDHATDEAEVLPEVDTPPKEWRSWDRPATDEEAAQGEALGTAIDQDDDDDNGLGRPDGQPG